MGYNKIAYKKAHTSLHISHIDATHHARNRDKSNSRQRSSDHAERNNIPGRTAVTTKESIVIGILAGETSHKQQHSEIKKYGQQNINSVHVIFLTANVRKIT